MKKLYFALTVCIALLLGNLLHGSDTFQGNYTGMNFPAYNSAAVTPSDSADLTATARAIYVGTGGNLVVELQNDTPGVGTTLGNVASGSVLPIRARRIHATNTTASGIVELW